MSFRLSALLLLLLLSLMGQYASADTSVHILSKNYNQLITSSTLNWISESHYSASKEFVFGGFENVQRADGGDVTTRPIFVCRALHNGVWVAGARPDGENKCTVSLTGSVRSYERYQLLENVENAARIGWRNWTKYYTTQPGTVASSDKLYVARLALDQPARQTHYIGTLNAQDSLGIITYVKEDGEEVSSEKGQVLVETEPISYELSSVKLNSGRSKVTKRIPRILGPTTTISNPGSSAGNMAEAFSYEYTYRLSWGQGHAMLRGLDTKITLVNKTKLPDIQWGIELKENRTAVYTVEVYLQPGTAVNVTLHGTYATVETPYSGKLSSRYDDDSSINARQIIDERQEDGIIDVQPEFGPVYYLADFSLVPTAPPTTPLNVQTVMSTAATTTTTTAASAATLGSLTAQPTTTTRQQQQFNLDDSQTEQQYSKEHVGVDENSIDRPQGDDGGPQSLKDKDHSAAINLSHSLFTLGLALLLAT